VEAISRDHDPCHLYRSSSCAADSWTVKCSMYVLFCTRFGPKRSQIVPSPRRRGLKHPAGGLCPPEPPPPRAYAAAGGPPVLGLVISFSKVS
jgi:hypothetical protein